MNEIAFSVFGLDIRWYAIILVTGMICALFLLMYLLKKTGQPSDLGLELFLWVIPFAVLFARLFYSVPRAENYPIQSFSDFINLFAIWNGGATIIGGIFGGIIGAFLCSVVRKKSFARIADVLICPLLLGQVIGRWGNFVNQEVYGLEVLNPAFQKFPFAVFIDSNGSWHYASFFYESFLNFVALIAFLVVFIKYRHKIKAGVMVLAYLAWYNIVRALLEIIKLEPLTSSSGVKITQTICAVLGAISIVLLILVQLGIIKLESEKMRKSHFAQVPSKTGNVSTVEINITDTTDVLNDTTQSDDVNSSKTDNENLIDAAERQDKTEE